MNWIEYLLQCKRVRPRVYLKSFHVNVKEVIFCIGLLTAVTALIAANIHLQDISCKHVCPLYERINRGIISVCQGLETDYFLQHQESVQASILNVTT